MHAILYRSYPPEGLLLNTKKPNSCLSSSQHRTIFPFMRAASNEYHH